MLNDRVLIMSNLLNDFENMQDIIECLCEETELNIQYGELLQMNY